MPAYASEKFVLNTPKNGYITDLKRTINVQADKSVTGDITARQTEGSSLEAICVITINKIEKGNITASSINQPIMKVMKLISCMTVQKDSMSIHLLFKTGIILTAALKIESLLSVFIIEAVTKSVINT